MTASVRLSRLQKLWDQYSHLDRPSPSAEQMTDSEDENDEEDSESAGKTSDEGIGRNESNASEVASMMVDKRDDDSIWSCERKSNNDEDPIEPLELLMPEMGLSTIFWGSRMNEELFDVITVHGLQDDQKTTWSSSDYRTDHTLHLLLPDDFRQHNYVYDNSDSARIFSPNGIAMEANELLNSVACYSRSRPIVWVCHDLGGSIVKQALINAVHNQPDPDPQDVSEPPINRTSYRELPMLTAAIIFLGCPQNTKSMDNLEDELLYLMHLPGPAVRTKMVQKIRSLASQVYKINMEFLETKALNRAIVLNTTAAPPGQKKHHMLRDDDRWETELTPDTTKTFRPPFSIHAGFMSHPLGIFYTQWLDTMDHRELVTGRKTSGISNKYCTENFFNFVNAGECGWRIEPQLKLEYLNSLLSLSPPTRVQDYRFYTEGFSRPDLISWVIEHDVFDKTFHQNPGPKTLYLHGGSRERHAVDMRSVSQQLYVAYDIIKESERPSSPEFGCFYFEFDRHDNRRCSIKAMITSFVCLAACHISKGDAQSVVQDLERDNCWSLNDLINVFLRVQRHEKMKTMTIMLGQIDQCDEEERLIFLEAILERQSRSDLIFHLLITTSRPEGSICKILPPDSVISLDDCPASLNEYTLGSPDEAGAIEDRMQILVGRRPGFARLDQELRLICEKFSSVPSLQDKVLEWLSNYKRGVSADEAIDMIREASSHAHHTFLQWVINQLSGVRKEIMMHSYRWIKYALEPLTQEVLSDAIRCSVPQELAQLQHIQNPDDFGEFVEGLMQGIVVRDGRDFRFSDEVFYSTSSASELHSEQDQTHRAQADMATACLRRLLGADGQEKLKSLSVEKQGMEDLDWSPLALPRHSLVPYALKNWTAHYQAAGDYRPIDLAARLLDTSMRRAWTEARFVISNPFTRIQKEYISPLPYMAMFGLDDLVRRQIEMEARQDCLIQDHWLAITEAARNGHTSTVKMLLEHTDMDVAGLREALRWATSYGEGGALDCLVTKAQQLGNFQWPPLILDRAVIAGLENLASALVQAGYDVNEEDSKPKPESKYDSPTGKGYAIHTAIEYGQDRILKIILDSGRADLGLKNDYGQSPLVLATEVGTAASIRYLLDAGASLDGVEEPRHELLLKTILSANHEALKTLFDVHIYSNKEVTHEVEDKYLSSFPLSVAATRFFQQCTRILLDEGADPNAVTPTGNSLYQIISGVNASRHSTYWGKPHVATCLLLLEHGANPNQLPPWDLQYEDNREDMPLMRAIWVGDKSLVAVLLDYGIKINVADQSRYHDDTPLCCAIQHDRYDIMELLLERGADPNLVSEEKDACWPPLYAAAYNRRPSKWIESLLKHGANVHWVRYDGWTALHAAYDSPDTMAILLQHGADINATNNENWTPLMLAVRNKQKQSVEFLLKQTNPKADLGIISTDDLPSTALHLACIWCDIEILEMLLEAGLDINLQIDGGQSPLALLLSGCPTSTDCEYAVDLMLKRKPNLGLVEDGKSVLHYIESETPLSVVMRLVEEGAPANALDSRGYNPLAQAVDCGNTNAARYLTTIKGVQSDLYLESDGSILLLAAETSTVDVVRQLARTGADHSVVHPVSGGSVLHSAIKNRNRQDRRNIIRYLVDDLGVDINAPDGKSHSPLVQVLLETDNKERHCMLKYLLRHGARTDQVDNFGRTALHWAAIRDFSLDTFKILVEFGADLSAADNYGRTALHFACGQGYNINYVHYILEKLPSGVDNVNLADVDGWTPLMWACRKGRDHVALALIDEYKADVCVRSNDGQWSPLKIACFERDYVDDELVEALKSGMNAQGCDESIVSQDLEVMHRWYRGRDKCAGCSLTWLQAVHCSRCDTYLCIKCVHHLDEMHGADHLNEEVFEFYENYYDENGDEGSDGDDSQVEYDGESGDGSEDGEEIESESEEDDSD